MPNEKVKIEIVKGVGGLCVCINDHRVAGVKPYGGGTVLNRWFIDKKDLYYALGLIYYYEWIGSEQSDE